MSPPRTAILLVRAQLAQISDTAQFPFYVAAFLGTLVVAILGLGLLLRRLAGTPAPEGIRRYVESIGGRQLPAGTWPARARSFVENGVRIHIVRYVDMQGNEHEAHCKAGHWSEVHFLRDSIVKEAGPSSDAPASESENERSRRQKEDLRHGQA